MNQPFWLRFHYLLTGMSDEVDSPETAALKAEEARLKKEHKDLLLARVEKRRLEVGNLRAEVESTPAATSTSAATGTPVSAAAGAAADSSSAVGTPLAIPQAAIQPLHTEAAGGATKTKKARLLVAIEDKHRPRCAQPSELPAELRGLFCLEDTTEELMVIPADSITIDNDSGDVQFDLEGDVAKDTSKSVFELAESLQEYMMETYEFSVVSLFIRTWIPEHMTQPVGLNTPLRVVQQLASSFVPGEGKCPQSHLSDISNGLVAMANKPSTRAALQLALVYMYLLKAGKPISASELGYSGPDTETLISKKKVAAGAGGGSNSKAKEWEGNCPVIRVVIKEKWTHMARPPGKISPGDLGGFPPGTNVWPPVTNADIKSIIKAAWMRIDAEGALEAADDKTKRARAMGKAKWEGTEGGADMMKGRAAANIRNNYTHARKDWKPAEIKATLLKEVNSRDAPGAAASTSTAAADAAMPAFP